MAIKDLTNPYIKSMNCIKTIFQYQISMIDKDKKGFIISIHQKQTGNSYDLYLSKTFKEVSKSIAIINPNRILRSSDLLDISMVEIGFVVVDFLFYINRKVGNHFFRIATEGEERTEMGWIKDIIPDTEEIWSNGELFYLVPRDEEACKSYQEEWKGIKFQLQNLMWDKYSEDKCCREFLAGHLDLESQKILLH